MQTRQTGKKQGRKRICSGMMGQFTASVSVAQLDLLLFAISEKTLPRDCCSHEGQEVALVMLPLFFVRIQTDITYPRGHGLSTYLTRVFCKSLHMAPSALNFFFCHIACLIPSEEQGRTIQLLLNE